MHFSSEISKCYRVKTKQKDKQFFNNNNLKGTKSFAKKKCLEAFFKTISRLWSPQGVREAIPQMRGSSTKGPVSHCPQSGSGYVEEV